MTTFPFFTFIFGFLAFIINLGKIETDIGGLISFIFLGIIAGALIDIYGLLSKKLK